MIMERVSAVLSLSQSQLTGRIDYGTREARIALKNGENEPKFNSEVTNQENVGTELKHPKSVWI